MLLDSRWQSLAVDGARRQQHLPADRCRAHAHRRRGRRAGAHRGGRAARSAAPRWRSILITHSHPDHARGVPALIARWPARRWFATLAPDALRGQRVDRRPAIRPCAHFTRPAMRQITSASWTKPRGMCTVATCARLGGTIVIPASAGGSLAQYLDSLRRIRALAPRRLLPGHGPVIDDPVTAD